MPGGKKKNRYKSDRVKGHQVVAVIQWLLNLKQQHEGEKNRLLRSSVSDSISKGETGKVSKTEKMNSSFLGTVQVELNGINAKLFACLFCLCFGENVQKPFILMLRICNLRFTV